MCVGECVSLCAHVKIDWCRLYETVFLLVFPTSAKWSCVFVGLCVCVFSTDCIVQLFIKELLGVRGLKRLLQREKTNYYLFLFNIPSVPFPFSLFICPFTCSYSTCAHPLFFPKSTQLMCLFHFLFHFYFPDRHLSCSYPSIQRSLLL